MSYKCWSKLYALGIKPEKVTYLTNDLYRIMSTFTSSAAYTRLEIGMMNQYGEARQQRKWAIEETLEHERK